MEGRTADELYGETLQQSTIDIGSTSAANGTLCDSQDNGFDDLWYEEGSSCDISVEKLNKASDMDREWERRRNQFFTIGYRDGLMEGKEASAQDGFNIGFKQSVSTGYNLGIVRGVTSAMACLPDELKKRLVETEQKRNEFQQLYESVHSLSTTDALKLFHEDQTRKSGHNENAKLSDTTGDVQDQMPDVIVLNNYYEELRSIISETPAIEVCLDMNQ